MCQKKPGNRCSNHARSALAKAQARFESEQSHEAFEALRHAEAEFDTTPAGQAELKRLADVAKTPEERVALLDRARQAERVHEERAEAIKAIHAVHEIERKDDWSVLDRVVPEYVDGFNGSYEVGADFGEPDENGKISLVLTLTDADPRNVREEMVLLADEEVGSKYGDDERQYQVLRRANELYNELTAEDLPDVKEQIYDEFYDAVRNPYTRSWDGKEVSIWRAFGSITIQTPPRSPVTGEDVAKYITD